MIQHNIHRELVLEIIKRYASEYNPITPTEILERITKEYPDHVCERKTIKSALDYLRKTYGLNKDGEWIHEKFCLHYDEKPRTSSIKRTNYWLEIKPDADTFSDDELLFLIDAVQFSKHISYKYADSIIKKLIKLSDNSFSDKFESYKNIDKEYHTVRPDFFLKIGDINRAIHQHKKISFFVNQYGVDKVLHPISEDPLIVSPYRIVTSDGNYYVIGREDTSPTIKSFRIDRITDVDVLAEGYASSPEMGRIKSHPEEYISEHRYFNNSKVVDVTLMIEKSILDEVIDSFGNNIIIEPADESSNSLTVHIKNSELDTINWAFRYNEHARIIEPKYLRYETERRAIYLLYYTFHEDEQEHYEDMIEKAKESGDLILSNVDLNKQSSFKEMKEITSACFSYNWLNDFSFLQNYPKLEELDIYNNTIPDTSVITNIPKLATLRLHNTGITNLDFLNGMDELIMLELDEYCLENIDAIYSMKTLDILNVNRSTAALIDEKKLKKIYSDRKFRYCVVDYGAPPKRVKKKQ